MSGKPKKRKVAGFMREVLGQNVYLLMPVHYKEVSNKPLTLAKDAGVSLSTVQRILEKRTGASLDNIEAIAGVFGLSTYQILLASLNISELQEIPGETKAEERMIRQWKTEAVDNSSTDAISFRRVDSPFPGHAQGTLREERLAKRTTPTKRRKA